MMGAPASNAVVTNLNLLSATNASSASRDETLSGPASNDPHVSVQAKAWAEYTDDDIKDVVVKMGITFLERKIAINTAIEQGLFILPTGFDTECPRLYKWFLAAGAVTKTEVRCTGPPIGTVKHAVVWREDQTAAQSYLDSLNNDAKRAERRLLISIIDFFQSLVRSTELPIREPTPGLFRAGAMFIEVFNEKANGIPRSVTAQNINRQALKNQVLEQLKQVFVTDGVPALLQNLGEIMLCKVYNTVCLTVETNYTNLLTEAIRPPVNVIADSLYRRVKEKVKVVDNSRGKRGVEIEKEVIKVVPPSFPSSEKEVGDIVSYSELTLLKEVAAVVAVSRTKDNLRIYQAASLREQADNISNYVEKSYRLTDFIAGTLKRRQKEVRNMCMAKAKQMIKDEEASSMKEAFTKELWQEMAKKFMDELADGTDLRTQLSDCGFFHSDLERPTLSLLQRWIER